MSPRTASKRIAIIGLGAIGKIVLDGISGVNPRDADGDGSAGTIRTSRGAKAAAGTGGGVGASVEAIVVRESQVQSARELAPRETTVLTSLDDLEAGSVDLIVECAGHEAVERFGEPALELGADLMVIATGALADDTLRRRLTAAAERADARILLPAGAIAGLDGLNALRRGGLESVCYSASKPPAAWIGTPAEDAIDLGAVDSATAFFTGSAAEAARDFPKNANLAATVALAGLGFERTSVNLIADPTTVDNVGRVEAEGVLGRLELELRGPPMADNPKTSVVTAYSILEAIERPNRTIVV